MRERLKIFLHHLSQVAYLFAWRFIKLFFIATFTLGLIIVLSALLLGKNVLPEEIFAKKNFVFALLPVFSFFVSGLSGVLNYSLMQKSEKQRNGNVLTDYILTFLFGYGFISMVYVMFTKL